MVAVSPKKIKIEIYLLSLINQEQANAFLEELGKVEGVYKVLPHSRIGQARPGEMSALLDYWLFDVEYHALVSSTLEHPLTTMPQMLGRMLSRKDKERLGKSPTVEGPRTMEAITIIEDNGIRTGYYVNSRGVRKKFINGDYCIDRQKTHAVLIGTSRYEEKHVYFEIPPIEGNLNTLFDIMTDDSLVGLPTQNVHKLFNASSSTIKSELRKISDIKGIETLIIYYAGHGTHSKDNQYFLTANDSYIRNNEPENHIPYSFIEDIQRYSPAAQKILFIDACLSGLAAKKNYTPDFSADRVSGSFILTSTSHNGASHFREDAEYTFFTEHLIDAFKYGAATIADKISLFDIYNYTKRKLATGDRSEPIYVSKLNILPENYFVSLNPNFSIEDELQIPQKLFDLRNYQLAQETFYKLEKKYPNDHELKRRFFEFEKQLSVKKLIEEANVLFYIERNYEDALEKYRTAQEKSVNELLVDKIYECQRLLRESTEPIPLTMDFETETDRKRPNKIIIFFIRLIAATIIGILVRFSFPYVEKTWELFFGKSTSAIIDTTHRVLKPVVTQAKPSFTKHKFGKKNVAPDIDTIPGEINMEIQVNDVEQFRDSCRNGNFIYAAKLIDNVKTVYDAEVWLDLAKIYHLGIGIREPNDKFAIEWYRRTAQTYHLTPAIDSLAAIYVEKDDFKTAIFWYQKSAKQGSLTAEEHLGEYYEKGKGTRPNRNHAIKWYHQAELHGSKIAKTALARLNSTMHGHLQ